MNYWKILNAVLHILTLGLAQLQTWVSNKAKEFDYKNKK